MQTEKTYEEHTLLALLAEDSEYAFQLIFDRYRNKIYKVAMMYVKSPVIAEEVVQDVFLKLWFQRKSLPEIRSLESWLFTLAKNTTLNCLRKIAHEWTARQHWNKENDSSENTADHRLLTADYNALLHEAINNLSPQQQQVYRLAKEEGMSYEHISEQMRISPLTVKTHMARALSSLRLFLKQNGDISLLLVLAGNIF